MCECGCESRVEIQCLSDNPTVVFAAEELAKYLTIITGYDTPVIGDCHRPDANAISVGLMQDFPAMTPPNVPDPSMDDAISVRVHHNRGVIAGINPRSVLLAVYRYLTELGCRWVRPGTDGEYTPKLNNPPYVEVDETPAYRHRGVCIEGSVSYEHVRDMVEWLPRVGCNAYFIQFREAHTFFDRWYAHESNSLVHGERLSAEKAREYCAGVEQEITKRGMIYHKVGHGWTCEPFGISGLGWEKSSEEIKPEIKHYFAEVGGKRELWNGVPLNTNLCYSNPEVRRLVTEEIANYAETNPHVDLLHFWLADGSNNNCECAECRKARPSDFYVMMLNEVDELLTKKNLKTKIVFLVYVDLMWPPEREKVNNPDRFVLMFAPITRSYSTAFSAGAELPELAPYVVNKLEMPKSVDLNVAHLAAWQKVFAGDSFDFDYHLMWDHVCDPGHIRISELFGQDMVGLRAIGLNGFISCQIQRVFFPTCLPMTVMARKLWNTDLQFDEIADDYFASAFGDDGQVVREYLTQLSDLFDPVYMRREKERVSPEAVERLSKVPEAIRKFAPVIERNLTLEDPCRAKSWYYLKKHAAYAEHFAVYRAATAKDDKPAAEAALEAARKLTWEIEPDTHHVFDPWLFNTVLSHWP